MTTAKATARGRRAVSSAALAMVGLSAVTTIAVLAYFSKEADPWSWRGLLALACIPFFLICGALLWKAPSRENASAALAVIVFSLFRIGMPSEWTWATGVLVVLTALAAAPVVWAWRSLPP